MDRRIARAPLTRRRFLLSLAATTAGGVLLSACAAPAPSPSTGGEIVRATPVPTAGGASAPAPTAAPAKPAQAPATQTSAGPAGQLKVGFSSGQPTMDPGHRIAGVGLNWVLPVYEALTWVDFGAKVEPMLATSWEQTSPTTWRFKLRQGVKFHNGDPFDAEAVKFTIERARDPQNQLPALTRVSNIAEVRIIDSHTVDLVTQTPDVILPKSMAQVLIGNGRYFASAGAEAYANQPVGTGPWRVTEYKANDYTKLDAFTDYWGDKPAFKEIEIRHIPEPAARIGALISGELDLIDGVEVDNVSQIQGAGRFKIMTSAQGSVTAFAFNYNEPWFADRRVREAVNLAINKEEGLRTLRQGFGRIADGQLVGPECFGYNPNLKPFDYDPARARQLLAEAGYPNGFETDAILTSNPTAGKDLGEAVAGYLAEVGITLHPKVTETAVFLDAWYSRSPRPGLLIQPINYDPAYDAKFVYSWFTTERQGEPFWGHIPEEYTQLWQQSNSETDPAKREQILQRMGAIMRDEVSSLFLWQAESLYALKNEIEWRAGPGIITNFKLARPA